MSANPPSLARLLQGRVISLLGAGGKTSLLFALADILRQTGLPVVCTTTTKMFKPEPADDLLLTAECQNLTAALSTALNKRGWALLGQELSPPQADQLNCPNQSNHLNQPNQPNQPNQSNHPPNSNHLLRPKLIGLSPAELSQLIREFPQVYFLIEADGAAGYPLKFPRLGEPVLPEADVPDQVSLGVLGLSGLGQNLTQAVHRAELAAQELHLASKTLITPSLLQQLGAALFYNTNPASKKIMFYNQVDILTEPERHQLAAQLGAAGEAAGSAKSAKSAGSPAGGLAPQQFMGSVHAGTCQAL